VTTQSSASSVKPAAAPLTTSAAAPFNLFGFMKKAKDKTASQDKSNVPYNQAHNQQQMLIEQQQQKMKQQKTDLKTISQYIKSFESIVIKSLRQYTLTTSVNLQTRILELLVQLIFLKVDYCLLDSDKVFIDYVLKQFEYLEQNHHRTTTEFKSSSSAGTVDEETGAQLLAKSYLVELYENFDSESTHLDPLNPFDVDTMLSKLSASLTSSCSSVQGALLLQGSSAAASSLPIANVISPISAANLSLRQQEHQQNHILIPKLFDFLLLLSHEKKPAPSTTNSSSTPVSNKQQKQPINTNKNNLLTIPEIMQLCDNLIASENSPHTHAIPALRPLVVDLFLNRSSDDSNSNKELDMQQDVVMMTMLRLVQYPQVWPLLTLAINKYRSGGSQQQQDKWKKCSRQVCDAFFDSIRASNSKLKFGEFNGCELRAVRRYSHNHVPYVLSLKQLLGLMNALAPQVYRPVDFILLSLFETSKIFFRSMSTLTSTEINNSLCILIFHLYILLNNSTEDHLLVRLFNLIPQIVSSFESELVVDENSPMSSAAKQQKEKPVSSTITSLRDSTHSHPLLSSSSSNRSSSSTGGDNDEETATTASEMDGGHFDLLDADDDDAEFNLSEAALFFTQFLLKIYENVFVHVVDKAASRWLGAASYLEGAHLTTACATGFLKDHQTNATRDLNYTQQLLLNKLMFLLYMVNSGSFNKCANALCLLVNDKVKSRQFKGNLTKL
jgi:hypothetical protein